MAEESIDELKKELRALVNQMIAFPEQDWTREGRRVEEIRAILAAKVQVADAA